MWCACRHGLKYPLRRRPTQSRLRRVSSRCGGVTIPQTRCALASFAQRSPIRGSLVYRTHLTLSCRKKEVKLLRRITGSILRKLWHQILTSGKLHQNYSPSHQRGFWPRWFFVAKGDGKIGDNCPWQGVGDALQWG